MLLFLKTDGMGRSIVLLVIFCGTTTSCVSLAFYILQTYFDWCLRKTKLHRIISKLKAILKYGNLPFQPCDLEGHRTSLPSWELRAGVSLN